MIDWYSTECVCFAEMTTTMTGTFTLDPVLNRNVLRIFSNFFLRTCLFKLIKKCHLNIWKAVCQCASVLPQKRSKEEDYLGPTWTWDDTVKGCGFPCWNKNRNLQVFLHGFQAAICGLHRVSLWLTVWGAKHSDLEGVKTQNKFTGAGINPTTRIPNSCCSVLRASTGDISGTKSVVS